MRGFLRSSDSLLSLAPKITTVGRENCDVTIQSPNVDLQHALIEFSEEERCFVLQDLNSSQGTYINDTRIQNAAVRLAPFDQIRFGYGGTVYQFELDDPNIQQRGWHPSSTITRNPYQPAVEQGLPVLPTTTQPSSLPAWVSQGSANLPQPPVASLRSRPLSAGTRKSTTEAPAVIRGTWVTPAKDSQNVSALLNGDDNLCEKDQKILRLTNEVTRLQSIVKDHEKKTLVIEQLNVQLDSLREQINNQKPNQDQNRVIDKLEQDLQGKKTEIAAFKDKINKLEKARKNLISEDTVSLQEFNDKLQELHTVRAELERVRKDKNIISGLVNQTQRDMSSKDTSISRLTREIEQLKKDVRNRDVQIATLTSKMSRVKQSAQDSSEEAARDKELVGLRLENLKKEEPEPRAVTPLKRPPLIPLQQFKNAENKIQELSDAMKTMKSELDRKTIQLADANAEQTKLHSEVQHCKAEFLDIQRAEKATRVDLEQISKKAERFRNRVVQVAFSTPGVKYPDDDIPDDQLMDSLKKLIDERTAHQKQITELKDQLKHLTGQEKKGDKALKVLKQQLNESAKRLSSSGFLTAQLKQELSLLQSVSISGSPENLSALKESLVDITQCQLRWQQDIEDALEKCGINVKLSTEAPSKHINDLFGKWESAIKEKDSIEATIKLMEANHKAELATQAAQFKEELAEKIADAREKARAEGEQRLNRAIEDLRSVETERRESMVDSEKRRCEELETNMAALKQSFLEQQEADKERLEAANEALKQLEDNEKYQESLKKEIENIQQQKIDEIAAVKEEYTVKDQQGQEDLQSYKEQIKQHSVTICSMEERLNKAQKKSKTLQQENSTLKQKIQELSSRPQPKKTPSPPAAEPPKAKVIVEQIPSPDVVALQQTIVTTRQECLDLKKANQEQQNVILGLQKDLAGAQARLSDMGGEIPESHKRELEMNRELVQQKSKELVDLQQQLAKLSTIVDKKTEAVSSAEKEAGTLKAKLERLDSELTTRDDHIKSLEMKMITSAESQNEQARKLEEDNQVKQELSSLGLACRGERHKLVIERQREALSELRRRIKELEMMKTGINPKAGGAADAALKQVDLLKRELAEMRSGNLADEHAMHDLKQMAAVERAVNKARGITSAADAENEHEKTAHRDTQEALEDSERSYLSLLRGIASCLDLDEIAGLQTMAHLPRDERDKLTDQRDAAAEALTNKIKALIERLNRKDELLRNYERDLAKLRQAELLVAKKSEQVEELVNDVQTRLDETMYLRTTLDRTKDRLYQEKRLNDSIKQKKTFHLENEKGPFVTNRRHVCPPDDLLAKEAAKKKKQIEKIRRKNYEIRTLKQELQNKHTQLCHTTTRLANLENDYADESTRFNNSHLEAV